MEIIRKCCLEGARSAEGTAVVIDVFRAFTCAPLFFHFGAGRLILEPDPEKARALKHENPGWVLVGEVNEVPLKDADMGNSPTHIIEKGEAFFRGRTVVHRTTAGVTGVEAASDTADEVILGSFVMARAIAQYILRKNPLKLTLVAMGNRAKRPAPEDEACADYLSHLLMGTPFDWVRTLRKVVSQESAQKFLQGKKVYLPREDPLFCLQRDVFDWVLAARKTDRFLEAKAVQRADRPESLHNCPAHDKFTP
ncbi:MAG: 2-phosphosulfolactate phosphatase [Desulfatiglandaceae bacterium]|jgi:2-phosphosulfolactate phosphatase